MLMETTGGRGFIGEDDICMLIYYASTRVLPAVVGGCTLSLKFSGISQRSSMIWMAFGMVWV